MDTFNKERFLAYGKWDYTINKSLYRNAAIVILVLFVGTTILSFLIHQAFGVLGPEIEEINTYQITSWMSNITKCSLAIMAGYLFHNMLTEKTRIMELTLPATVQEKFWWHVAVCIGGTFVVCVVGYIVSDIVLMLLSLIFMGPEYVNSIIVTIFTCDLEIETIMQHLNIYRNFERDGIFDKEGGREFVEAFTNFMNKTVYYAWALGVLSYAFYTGIFAYVNSRKYRHNIPLTIVILICIGIGIGILAVVGCVIWFAAIANNPNEIKIMMGDLTFATALIEKILIWVLVIYAVEGIISALLWIGTYRNYKKATLTNK